MLRLTIDLIPLGNEKQKKTLSVLEIENKMEISELGGSRYTYTGFVIPVGDTEKCSLYGWANHGYGKTVYALIKKIVDDIEKYTESK